MKKQVLIIFAFSLILLISMMGAEIEANQIHHNQFHSYIRQGIESAFNMEMQHANACLQKAVELDKDNPTAYAFLALAQLFAYEMSFESKEREKHQASMLHYVNETMVKGKKIIGANSNGSQAYFAMSLAKIARLRLAVTQRRYFSIARETAAICDYLEKARKKDPQNYDIYFPIGLLHYHFDQMSGFPRFLSSFMPMSGDRSKGLQELELAAQKGTLVKELAQAELLSIYTNFEKTPSRALPIAQCLKARFPKNFNFSFAVANVLSDLHRFDEAYAIARDIENGIRNGNPPFVPQLQPRYDQLMARIFFNQEDYNKANEYLQKALNNTCDYNARVRVWSFVHIGMIHDIHKERKRAEENYARALEIEGGEGAARLEAEKYIKSPYRK